MMPPTPLVVFPAFVMPLLTIVHYLLGGASLRAHARG
jgi:hypothetical protein